MNAWMTGNSTNTGGLFFLIIVIIFGVYFLLAKRRGFRDTLESGYRDIPAYEQLNRAIRLAVETGQQIHCSLGSGGLFGRRGISSLVGGQLLNSVVRKLAYGDRPTFATSGDGLVSILAQDEQRRAYSLAGISVQDSLDITQVSGITPWSYAAGVTANILDQQVAINVLLGHFGSEVCLLTEASDRNQDQIIGASDSLNAQAVLFASTQAPIIGEELYAAGAYGQPDPWQSASIKTQDLLRWLLIGLIVTGLVLRMLGVM